MVIHEKSLFPDFRFEEPQRAQRTQRKIATLCALCVLCGRLSISGSICKEEIVGSNDNI